MTHRLTRPVSLLHCADEWAVYGGGGGSAYAAGRPLGVHLISNTDEHKMFHVADFLSAQHLISLIVFGCSAEEAFQTFML